MPYLEVERLFISDDVWMKVIEKHELDTAAVRAEVLSRRRHRFIWRMDRRGGRAELFVVVDGSTVKVVLRPRSGAPSDHWNLATAFRP